MAPTAVKTAIRQNDFDEAALFKNRFLAFDGPFCPVEMNARCPLTRIILESQAVI